MATITAKQLHQETKAVLNQLESGETFILTRRGRTIARIEPVRAAKPSMGWSEVMGEVWEAQAAIRPAERAPNPVLRERQRRRR